MVLGKLGVPVETIQLIKSFHEGMRAAICLDGKKLEISVENGLRQGCQCSTVLQCGSGAVVGSCG